MNEKDKRRGLSLAQDQDAAIDASVGYELAITSPTLTRRDFHAYFNGRPHYHLSPHQAWYENEETGVYFSFDLQPEAATTAVLKLNFFRPHFFALEAEPELAALVDHFQAGVRETSKGASGRESTASTYESDNFLSAWNQGNAEAYTAMLQQKRSCRYLQGRPKEELEKVWRWNFQRTARMEELPPGVHVPKLMYVTVEEDLVLTCIWSDAMPVLLPMVERVILHRKAMAPSSFFQGRKEDSCFLSWEEVLPEVSSHHVSGYEFPAYQLPERRPGDPAPEFVQFFRKQKKTWEVLEGLEPDKILNRELLEKAKREISS